MLVITPSPPAAAVPDRMAVGMDQKGPVKAKVAEAMAQMREDYRKAAEALPDQEQFLRAAGAWAAEEMAA